MGEHQWARTFRCMNAGCRVTRHAVYEHVWRLGGYGAKWRKTPIPKCKGAEQVLCTHVERVPVALNPGHRVVGGFKVGRCERPALPRMVVCERHATPDALRIVILVLEAELARNSAPR
jgi:hypothetical protein